MMKKIILSCFLAIPFGLEAQENPEKEIKTEVGQVTVFLDGAQVSRKKEVLLQKGKNTLRFSGLSPYIDASSIQVKVSGNLTILAVNHQQNYLDKLLKSEELKNLEKKQEELEQKIKEEETHLSVLRDEMKFMEINRNIGGTAQGISTANLRETAEYYRNSLYRLRFGEVEKNIALEKLHKELLDILNQINTITGRKEFPSGEIILSVDAKSTLSTEFEISYLVSNASWFPSYDIRAKSVSEPVNIIYKANVRQDTKVDWKDVKITLSTSDPKISGVAPELQPWYLNYNAIPPRYNRSISMVSGRITDQAGHPLPGVNIIVQGTTIGTVSDMDGNYRLTLPPNASLLSISYVGYQSQEVPIDTEYKNIQLSEEVNALEELAITGYGGRKKSLAREAIQGQVAGVMVADDAVRIKENYSSIPETVQARNQTSMEFAILTPYTIKSDNKSYSIDMSALSLRAYYEYFCIPKIEKDAFLIANIVDWEQYSFLEGEASIFFEDTYVGKTILDVRYVSDTLKISLGRDKNILIERDKEKEFTSKKLLGSKKEDTRAWNISVKNNKTEEINMVLLDQVPVSTLEEIEVNVQNASGAKQDIKSGELKWEFKLKPGESKNYKFRYIVKYPANKNLIIE